MKPILTIPMTLKRLIGDDSGTTTYFNGSSTADVIAPTNPLKALKVTGFFMYGSADATYELRFKTSTNVIAGLNQKGAVGMNLVGAKKPTGKVNETIELYISGSVTVKGWINTKEVMP